MPYVSRAGRSLRAGQTAPTEPLLLNPHRQKDAVDFRFIDEEQTVGVNLARRVMEALRRRHRDAPACALGGKRPQSAE